MAITGLVWIGYVIMHMYGNLKVFNGPEAFNHYAEGLRTLGAPVFGYLHLLTVARVGLIVALVVHIWAAYTLWNQARAARPTSYIVQRVVQANYPSMTMRYGGTAILLYVIFHLMQLTWGTPVVHGDFVRGDPYHNLVYALQGWPSALIYIAATVALGMHLYHGTWSMFQTLGLKNRDYDKIIRGAAIALAIIVPVGFAIVPIAILFGIVN
jgi:succinate dehydrogenase / fumarate reductase cytochrome b subunit